MVDRHVDYRNQIQDQKNRLKTASADLRQRSKINSIEERQPFHQMMLAIRQPQAKKGTLT